MLQDKLMNVCLYAPVLLLSLLITRQEVAFRTVLVEILTLMQTAIPGFVLDNALLDSSCRIQPGLVLLTV